jgi:hypothetical protein
LHAELVQDAKDNAGRIGQICHDHADVFLASVAKVAALEKPSADLADGLKSAHDKLQLRTAGPMRVAEFPSRQQPACTESIAEQECSSQSLFACRTGARSKR